MTARQQQAPATRYHNHSACAWVPRSSRTGWVAEHVGVMVWGVGHTGGCHCSCPTRPRAADSTRLHCANTMPHRGPPPLYQAQPTPNALTKHTLHLLLLRSSLPLESEESSEAAPPEPPRLELLFWRTVGRGRGECGARTRIAGSNKGHRRGHAGRSWPAPGSFEWRR
jgi:hypothetical protein